MDFIILAGTLAALFCVVYAAVKDAVSDALEAFAFNYIRTDPNTVRHASTSDASANTPE